jgi:D-methionine transport system substrate-binding protein
MRKAKFLLPLLILFMASCSQDQKKSLRIVASPTPHSEMIEFLIPEMKKQGINLEVITITDYLLPNKLVDEKEVDANFFQHTPFLIYQKNEQGLNLEILGKIHLEPMGLYSLKLKSKEEFSGKTLALPLDPSNEARALKLLKDAGLITLSKDNPESIYDIKDNPYNLQFLEVDAAILPRLYEDIDLAIIPTNFALQAGLNPSHDALFLEAEDSPYANIIVIHPDSTKKQELHLLLDCLQSEQMKSFIKQTYKGAIIPAK